MEKTTSIIVLVVVILISIIIGAYGYFMISKGKTTGTITEEQQAKIALVDSMKSSLVNTITITGEVKDISENTVTIWSEKTNEVINVMSGSDRAFSKATKGENGKYTYSDASFSDVEVGGTVVIEAEISSTNQLSALFTTIY